MLKPMNDALDILGLGFSAFSELAGLGPGKASLLRAAYGAALSEGRWEPERFLSRVDAAALGPRFRVGLLVPGRVEEEPGELGLTAKALLTLEDGAAIECVRIPSHGGKASLCVSSQVGCRMGCAFCETGRAGLTRSLSAAEIVSQAVTAKVSLGWDFRNIVFMGMGEPLDNLAGLSGALAVLFDPAGLGLAQERITVCTVGLPGGLAALKALGYRRLGLSVSLNAPSDEIRGRLMPAGRAYGLARLASDAAAFASRRNFMLGVNYCLIPGLNDGPAVDGVAAFAAAAGRCLVNVIPYNPGSRPLGRAPSEAEVEAFASSLAAAGLAVRVRAPRGRGLMAACGQLGGASLPFAVYRPSNP